MLCITNKQKLVSDMIDVFTSLITEEPLPSVEQIHGRFETVLANNTTPWDSQHHAVCFVKGKTYTIPREVSEFITKYRLQVDQLQTYCKELQREKE